MDPTPTSTPVIVKRTRVKAATVATTNKPTLSAKPKARTRKEAPVEIETAALERVTPAEQIAAMIATTAYYLAEKRGFAPGGEIDDWLIAEDLVKISLAQ